MMCVASSSRPCCILREIFIDLSARPFSLIQWYARPVQIVQWTLGSTPAHPILLDTLSRIANSTQGFPTWSAERAAKVAQLRTEGNLRAVEKLVHALPWVNPKVGGYKSVMEWTGPGVFTDSVFR